MFDSKQKKPSYVVVPKILIFVRFAFSFVHLFKKYIFPFNSSKKVLFLKKTKATSISKNMGLEANVLAFVAKCYGLNKKDSSHELPTPVTAFVISEIANCRSKGVLSASGIESIAHRCFDKMTTKQQQFYTHHRKSLSENHSSPQQQNQNQNQNDEINLPNVNNNQQNNNNQHQHHVLTFDDVPSRRPTVPRCGIRKVEPIRRHMAGPPRPASTSPTQHIPHKVEEYIRSILRPSSQMNYATKNSFRRLQRQQLDADWFAQVQDEAKNHHVEKMKLKEKQKNEKDALAAQVRQFYREKERGHEDKFLEKEAERIESQQWYEHNTDLERREKMRLAQKRTEEFKTFVEQARDFRNKKEKEKSDFEKEDVQFRKEIERGIAEDKFEHKKRFNIARDNFVAALHHGTEIARKHRQDEKQADKQFDKKLVADAKQVLATQKEREAEEKARRLTRVKKHEQLQDQAAELYKKTVAVREQERQKHIEDRTNREVEKVEEQYRKRRLGDKQHVVDMKKQLQSALKETVEFHQQQKEEHKKEEVKEKKMVQESVRREIHEAKSEVEVKKEQKEKLKQQQEEDILQRNQMLLRAPKLKITDRK